MGLTDGERRHLTVLFCDLVGSTEIAARLDPEEWRDIAAQYQRSAAEALTHLGGHVAEYVGDGLVVYFGWPEAHEDDAERAVRAGLAVVDAIALLNIRLTSEQGVKLSVRAGIDTGSVVVGRGGSNETRVFGQTPNIAARVQAAAAPNTVLITASTHRLVSGLFVFEELGAHQLKGLAKPVELYRVLRPTGVRGRLAAARGLTPFVGREEELRLLLSRWERAREGEGQLVVVVGEAGIGKSRLVAEFHDRIRDTPHIWMESAGEQFFQNTPFHAISEMLSQWLEPRPSETGRSPERSRRVEEWVTTGLNAERMERLERTLASAGLKAEAAVPLIADLLQIAIGERYPAITLNPEQKRRQLLAALTGWVFGAAKLQPVAMVVEDLHWLDPSTLELEQLLAAQGMMVPLMLMCTARPEFKAPWPMRSHHTQITLNRLSARAVREMVALVAARNALASENVEAVIERTGGVPLFVEELTRAVLESGTAKLTAHEIPVTLHDSLMARLDRLGSAKDVLQVGSVIGSEFSYGLLRAVHPASEQELERELRKLTDADLLYFRGIAPDATYQFKHALIRDTAYEALLKTRRRELHSRIAQILDISFTEIAAAHPELLAHHYTEAGLSTQAIPYWQRAGQQAVERSANVEAISHLNRGLELIKALPDAADHAAEELKIRIALGVPLGMTKGYASPESQAVYERARELCEQVGDTQQLGQVLWHFWHIHHLREEFQRAREQGEELLIFAQRNHDRDLLLQAHHALWTTLILLGEFVLAREHLEQGMAIYDPEQHRSHAFFYGHDPGACCRAQRGYVLWYLGYPEQAMKSAQEAIALAQKLSHPYSLVMMLECATMIDQLCRNVRDTQERAETVVALAREQGFPVWSALATLYHGWALAQQGLEKEGASELHQGMAAYRASGAGLGLPYQLARLAEVYERTGQVQEGLSALTEALAATEKTGDRRWVAELYRLKGVLTLQSPMGVQKEAEEFLREAVAIARNQQAKSLELRATMSLARLFAAQGKRDEARAILAEIYGWFTEGFDTADLKDAKALLGELA